MFAIQQNKNVDGYHLAVSRKTLFCVLLTEMMMTFIIVIQ